MTLRSRPPRALACAAFACAMTAAGARADVSAQDAAKATALFKQGQAIMDANPTDHAQIDAACELFEASLRIDSQVGTMLNLASCRELQNRLVDAYRLYQTAAELAAKSNKKGRATFARKQVAALGAKVVHVTLHVAGADTPGLTVKLAGQDLAASEWAHPQLVDPGTLDVEVAAPGKQPFTSSQKVAAGAAVTIEVPALEAVPVPVAPPPVEPAVTTAPPPPVVARDDGWFARRGTLVVGITGGALVATSIALGLDAKSRYDSAKDRAAVSSAQTEANIGTGFAIAGAVGLAAATYLFFHYRDQPRVVIAPTAMGTTTGLAVAHRF